jgi:uncharacterized repeat protein (TIGR03803 family)
MQQRSFSALLIGALIALLPSTLAAGAKEKILYRFTGGTDGGVPSSSLTMDAAGKLYGTTNSGGDLSQCSNYGCGTVFQLTPSSNGKWTEKVLHAFKGGSDGSYPTGNLLFDAAGNLYGTTSQGGSTNCSSYGCGTVFQLSPNQDGTWTETILYSFQGQSDGREPAGLTFDRTGILYGATVAPHGTVYSLSPPKQQGGAWKENVLYDLSAFGATANPVLAIDEHGNLYGTYYQLDKQYCLGDLNCGAVFELEHASGQWQETDLHDFIGGGTGGQPAAGVIRDGKGKLYGTTALGGNNYGIVFELRASAGGWKEHMIYNFCSRNNCADGAYPLAALVVDKNGALYGTTYEGGGCINACGVVFKLAHMKNSWHETVLHKFGGLDGENPQESLILDAKGSLYGVAASSVGAGVVFELTP